MNFRIAFNLFALTISVVALTVALNMRNHATYDTSHIKAAEAAHDALPPMRVCDNPVRENPALPPATLTCTSRDDGRDPWKATYERRAASEVADTKGLDYFTMDGYLYVAK